MKCNKMKKAIETILENHGYLEAFNTSNEFHIRINHSSPAMMPLVIEKLERIGLDGKLGVSVCHFYTQNGDTMRDPEIVFDWETWIPVMYQQDSLGLYQETHLYNSSKRPWPPLIESIKSFAEDIWASNLLNQRYGEADMVVSSLTHEKTE